MAQRLGRVGAALGGGHHHWQAWILEPDRVRSLRRFEVILSNDVRAEPAFPRLVEAILGPTGFAWDWEYPPAR